MSIRIEIKDLALKKEMQARKETALKARKKLYGDGEKKQGPLGWLHLPGTMEQNLRLKIKEMATEIRNEGACLLVIGIGGSYLGAKAGIEVLKGKDDFEVLFLGHHLSEEGLQEAISKIASQEVYLNVISKSGKTLEPSVLFRILRSHMQKKYDPKTLKKRIIFTTDEDRGLLHDLAQKEGYRCLPIPEDIGGRFSVLTAVGLLPMAVQDIDIEAMLAGAKEMEMDLEKDTLGENGSLQYALSRNVLYELGKRVELYVYYEPRLFYFCEWLKQLFGESEGKEGKGIFPASSLFTADLHALGQFIQEGSPILFETVLYVENTDEEIYIPKLEKDDDQLDYLAGKPLSFVRKKAMEGTVLAHEEGGVRNLIFSIPTLDAYHMGQLFYLFETACAISGYLMGVNPFDQPGVESYKKNVSRLLREKI